MCHTWHSCPPLVRLLIAAAVAVAMHSCRLNTVLAADPRYCEGSLVLRPLNPEVEDGSWLTLNCTILPAYAGKFTSHDIYFTHGHGQSIYNSTSVDGRQTALLRHRWTIADDDIAGGHIHCMLPDCSHDIVFSAMQHVTVVRQPMQPRVGSCHVLSWHSVRCTWQPTSEEQHDHMHTGAAPAHLVQWRIASNDAWQDAVCVGDVINSCTWNMSSVVDRIHSAAQLCVQVTPWITLEHLQLRSTSVEFCFVPSLNVIVDTPRHLTHSVIAQRQVAVRWEAPALDTSLVSTGLTYSVIVLSQWAEEPVVNTTVTDLFLSFDSLPYTKYSASVRAKTLESHLWSLPAQHNFTTNTTIPRHSPRSTSNAFTVRHVARHTRTVTVYWQTLPARDHYGSRLRYMVQIRKSTSDWSDLKSVRSPVQACTDVIIDRGTDVELTVIARNSQGSTQPDVTWRLPAVNPDTPGEGLVQLEVELAGRHTVIWSWTLNAMVGGDNNVTLFWCQGQSPVSDRCTGDIHWLDMSASQTEYNLTQATDVSTRQYSYGAALRLSNDTASPRGISGGIHWVQCVYNASALAPPVHGLTATVPSHAKPGDVLVMWQHPACEITHGYIRTLVLCYCHSNAMSQCEGDSTEMELPGHLTSFNLTGLDPGTKYLVWLYSVTRAGRSTDHSDVVTVVTSTPFLTPAVIAGLSIALVIFILLAVAVVWAACKYCRRCHKKLWSPMDIAPPAPDVRYRPQTSYAPAVEYNRMSYQRQGSRLSSSSHESGQFVMTPDCNVSDSGAAIPLMMDNHRPSPQPSDNSWHLSPSPRSAANPHNHVRMPAALNHSELIPLRTYPGNSPAKPAADDLHDDDDVISAGQRAAPSQPPRASTEPAQRNGGCEPVLPPTSDYIKHELLRL